MNAALYARTLGGIQECFGSFYNNCYTCVPPMNLCGSLCYCNNNYYWDGSTCTACNSVCSICNGTSSNNCLLPKSSTNNVCSDGYFYYSEVCDGATFSNCFACDPTCFNCSGPYSNNCTSCIKSATLQSDNTCLCTQGSSGTPPLCIWNYFTAVLSVNASDVAKIVFSEPLAQQLTTSNISVSINSVTQNFSIIMIDEKNYYIDIIFDQNITQNNRLEILFSANIVSQNNSLLLTSNLNATLYNRTLGGIKECYESKYNNCYTCASPMALCTSLCYCNTSFYWDGTTCSACDSSCLICNGASANTCLLPKWNNNNVCIDGYFFHSDTCDAVSYSNCFPCDPSCFNCTGPFSTDCISCGQNATLQSNNACSCRQGWSGTPSLCSRNYFTATLFINASNKAIIVFSEPLGQQLLSSNLSVLINNTTQDFTIIMINSSSYLIEIVYDETVLQNRSLQIFFSGSIVSQNNSLLSAQTLNKTINPCQFLNFNVSISLTSDNSLILSFHEKLSSPLTQKDVELLVSNIKHNSFTLIEYSISSYLINVTYDENIEVNSSLKLLFSNPIYSICNDSLKISEYIFYLNPTVLSYDAFVSYQSEQTAGTVTQSVTIGSVSISVLNLNFVTLWNFLNTIQLLCYIQLSTISLPPKFGGQLKGLKKFNMVPNMFGYLLNESDYKIKDSQFVNFGFTSSSIFFNCGSMITIGVALFALLFVSLLAKLLLFITPCKLSSLRSKLESFVQSFKYGRFIRYLIQAYLDLLASAFISLILFKTDTAIDVMNIIVSIILLIILAVSPVFFLKITKQKNENNGLMSLYGTLFSEFSNTQNLSSSLFYFFFFLRRLLYIVIILFVPNIGLLKLTLNLIVFLSVIFI